MKQSEQVIASGSLRLWLSAWWFGASSICSQRRRIGGFELPVSDGFLQRVQILGDAQAKSQAIAESPRQLGGDHAGELADGAVQRCRAGIAEQPGEREVAQKIANRIGEEKDPRVFAEGFPIGEAGGETG